MNPSQILIVGNSDGIGLATTRILLDLGWQVIGLSRSDSPLVHENYQHTTIDVLSEDYVPIVKELIKREQSLNTCLFCVGVGNELEEEFWLGESRTIATNFLSAVQTLETLLPAWLARSGGHFIGLSSLVDSIRISDAASYSGSKAGLSNYLESIALRLRKQGVFVSNVRFGFVDTKMADAPIKPAMMTTEAAARVILNVIEKKPIRLSRPRRILPVVSLVSVLSWLQVIFR